MNKKELKKVLKPMIKECIHEILLGEGILSGIISEVAKGLGTDLNEKMETRASRRPQQKTVNETFRDRMRESSAKDNINESKRALMASIGADAYNGIDLFEGTQPLKSGGSPNEPHHQQGALAGVDASDPGVDITGIMNIGNRDWSKLI